MVDGCVLSSLWLGIIAMVIVAGICLLIRIPFFFSPRPQTCEDYATDWVRQHHDTFDHFGKFGSEAAQTYIEKSRQRDSRGETEACIAEFNQMDKNITHFVNGPGGADGCKARGGVWNDGDNSCTINLP